MPVIPIDCEMCYSSGNSKQNGHAEFFMTNIDTTEYFPCLKDTFKNTVKIDIHNGGGTDDIS